MRVIALQKVFALLCIFKQVPSFRDGETARPSAESLAFSGAAEWMLDLEEEKKSSHHHPETKFMYVCECVASSNP